MTSGYQSAEQLFREHARFVADFLHRLGAHDSDIEDLVQEVFMVAHRKGGYHSGPARPRSWLASIAIRLAAASRRASARRREDYDEAALDAIRAEGRSAADPVEIAESMLRVQQVLDRMDLDHRAVFVLYEIEGESCDGIAAALQVPVGTVYSRLHHARRYFREAYDELFGGEGCAPCAAGDP